MTARCRGTRCHDEVPGLHNRARVAVRAGGVTADVPPQRLGRVFRAEQLFGYPELRSSGRAG